MQKAIVNFTLFSMLLGILPFNTQAQELATNLSLEEAISASLGNNQQIKTAGFEKAIAEANFKQTNSIYLPQVGVSYSAFTTNNPLNAFGFKLQQQSIMASDFNPALLNDPSNTSNFLTKVDVQQPLFNLDANMMRKSVNKQIEVYQLSEKRTKEAIAYETKKAYLQLQMAYEAEMVLSESFKASQGIQKFISDRFKQGLVSKPDMLNVEVQVSAMKTRVAEAKSNINNASDYLSLLMGKQNGQVYKPADIASASLVSETSQNKLPDNRSDFLAMQKGIESSEWMSKSGKMSYLPKLNAFGSYYLNDKDAFGFGSKSYFAGLQLSWDIFKGTKTRHVIESQQLTSEKLASQLASQKAQNQLLVNKTEREINDNRLSIQQHELAVAQAEEAFKLLDGRFKQGLVTTSDLLLAHSQLEQQKLGQKQAIITSHLLFAYMQFLTVSE
jgi:outer membrane protein TolC